MNLEEAKHRITTIESEIMRLYEEKRNLYEQIRILESNQINKRFLNEITHLSGENSVVCWLSSDTKTTPIMDRFQHSDKSFLIFKCIYSVELKGCVRVSLVVRKGVNGISAVDDGLTMTDLKKSVGDLIYSGNVSKSTRYQSLKEEVLVAAAKVSGEGEIVAFEHPVRLGGQTYANQTGFGSEYHGEVLLSQGTLYGETTGFYIIGIICEHMW